MAIPLMLRTHAKDALPSLLAIHKRHGIKRMRVDIASTKNSLRTMNHASYHGDAHRKNVQPGGASKTKGPIPPEPPAPCPERVPGALEYEQELVEDCGEDVDLLLDTVDAHGVSRIDGANACYVMTGRHKHTTCL